MAFDPSKDHSISLKEASKLTKRYRDDRGSSKEPIAGAFGHKAFKDILEQKDCVGIRVYYAKDDNKNLTTVLVGIDSNGNDLYEGRLMEWSGLCPPLCGEDNPLNADV